MSYKNKNSTTHFQRWLLLAMVIVLFDQFTKVLLIGAYQLGDATHVTEFFNVVRVHNTGAAFSFLAHAGGWQRWFFTALAIVAVVVMLWLLKAHSRQNLFACAISLVLAGAMGNLIDRLWHGYVIDFLDFHMHGWHFPAFNVADSAITCGAALLIWDELRRVRRS